MEFCINAEQLRKALKDIEKAESNGFDYCLAVFKLTSAGQFLSDCRANYSDLFEMAHPTKGKLNWGRSQSVTKHYKFKKGKLVKIEDKDIVQHEEAFNKAVKDYKKGKKRKL